MIKRKFLPYSIVPAAFLSPLASAAEPLPPLEEVLVTSQRYESPLQEVPVSVHVISGESIEQARIVNMVELSQSVPNLVVGEGAINTNIYMRGVGSGTNRAFEQSVGMFIDEIYMGRGSQFRAPFLDLQQVDVLRGPQGALFGKNTIAGAVVVTTAKPSLGDDFSAEFTLDYEPEYNDRALTSIFSGALSDKWAARLVNKTARHDGYWENTYKDNDEPEIEESITRLSLLYEPTGSLRFDSKWEHSKFETAGSSVQIRQLDPLDPTAQLLIARAYIDDPDLDANLNSKRSVDNFDLPEYRNQTVDNAVITAKYDAGAARISYTLGYSSFETEDSQDLDYLPVQFISVDDEREFEQWSQEIRVDQDLNESHRLQWGVYWQDQQLDANFQENLALPPLGPIWDFLFALNGIDPTVFPPTPFTRNTAFEQSAETWALFAEWDWHFAEDWRLLLGGRYNREKKDYRRISSQDEFLNPGVPASAGANVTALFFDVNVLSPAFEGSRTEDDFLPSIKLWWDASATTNAYAKIERGAKSGGYNAVADAAPGDQEYEDEQAITYEVGTKSLYADGRLSLNSAIFYTEIEDLQMTVLNGSRFLVGNAAESVSKGVELDGSWRINGNWQITGYTAYLDAIYKDFEDGPCTAKETVAGASTCDLSGETTPYAPEWSAGLGLDYEYALSASMDVLAGLQLSYSDDYAANADLDPEDSQDSYTKYDAHIALRGNHWELGLIGKNLTNEKVVSYSLDTPLIPGGHAAYLSPLRTYALRLRLSI